MNPDTQRAAKQCIAYLTLPDAIERKGHVWCETHAMLLQMGLSSITELEAEQRLEKQMAEIKQALGAQS